ncbi:hypothetical protein DFP72DRAFT_1179427 [Ephemerocybe angulata]|uniref:CxC5 like cysteine cluster associated with KDZ domain-containing protein n=2 Tax=Ephemerocybe angulata TaxID=980116 RepID=A0A8H6H8A5_9AGAR|nr:hypothetical protein DFP72DRAFT_1179427 [Tulosesus angulatus]
MTSISIPTLLSALDEHVDLLHDVTLSDIVVFVDICCLLRPTLDLPSLHSTHSGSAALERLPIYAHDFLKACLGWDDNQSDSLKALWYAFKDTVWAMEYSYELTRKLGGRYLPLFVKYGPSRGIAMYHFVPPTRTCLDPACRDYLRTNHSVGRERQLVDGITYPVVVFTQEFGAVPGHCTSLYCNRCKTRYYNNYYITGGTRTYYVGDIPPFLHTAEKTFMDIRTCELFSTMMVTTWVSATNCARIYNDGISKDLYEHSLLSSTAKSTILDVETVWNSLFLYWLVQDAQSRNVVFEYPDSADDQALRLKPALRARNERIAGPGQPEWNHVCDLCCAVEEVPGTDDLVYIRSIVVDGVTVGRPCCGVHDCMNELDSVKDHYCQDPEHQKLVNKCAVIVCKAQRESGHRTCGDPDHRALDSWANMHAKAMFQLRQRLERINATQAVDLEGEGGSEPADNPQGSTHLSDEAIDVDESGICDSDKPETGNRTLRAQFGRKRTHNEELCVASCGVILGRATFYGSEAPNGVRTFLMYLFPTQESLPQVIWHDNNCKIRAMLENDDDPYFRDYFKRCALPVDVFHFNCKHKESDIMCQKYCNPYSWEQLRVDGKWRFNSSAAEQANVWFGSAQPVVREMQAVRYDFFLDEMIIRRNKYTVSELKRKGKSPLNIPRHLLLGTD